MYIYIHIYKAHTISGSTRHISTDIHTYTCIEFILACTSAVGSFAPYTHIHICIVFGVHVGRTSAFESCAHT